MVLMPFLDVSVALLTQNYFSDKVSAEQLITLPNPLTARHLPQL
jgi:hypothetical protein